MKISKYIFLIICILFIHLTVDICHLSFPAFAQAIAPDPTRFSVGGRVLGMGKAFVGLADDASSIYTNPAGLGSINTWQILSMSGRFMEDFSYLNIAGAYPTNYGIFGAGFSNSSIDGGYATRIKAGTTNVYEVDPTQPTISYYNNVGILSYGTKLQNIFVGANLKLFMSGMSGDGITKGSANGKELDLGILMKLNNWLSIGSTVQNVLPSTMGGKLEYESGHSEYYPAVLETGIAVKPFALKNLTLLFDFDYYPTRKGYPIIYHTGFEWFPVSMACIRAGIDQDAAGDGTGTGFSAISNLTFGAGLNFNNFKFDYAFHQFTGAAGMTNSFFSLSYSPTLASQGGVKEKSKWEKIIEKTSTSEAVPVIIVPEVKSKVSPIKKIVKKPVIKKGGSKNVKKKLR